MDQINLLNYVSVNLYTRLLIRINKLEKEHKYQAAYHIINKCINTLCAASTIKYSYGNKKELNGSINE